MDAPNLPKLVDMPAKWRGKFGTGKMLVPSPLEVEAVIRTVRKGRLITVTEIREILRGKHAANVTCPLTTGIFVRISAEAAEEDAREGKQRITPYWRVVKDDGSLNPKFPGGVERQADRLRDEGHRIEPARGKRQPRVVLQSAANA